MAYLRVAICAYLCQQNPSSSYSLLVTTGDTSAKTKTQNSISTWRSVSGQKNPNNITRSLLDACAHLDRSQREDHTRREDQDASELVLSIASACVRVYEKSEGVAELSRLERCVVLIMDLRF